VDILYLLVPLSVVLVFLVGAVFWYAVESGQFDDLEGPALKVIADDDDFHIPNADRAPAQADVEKDV
jgi:cbb3-type cytochrome oxidase maturation protein